MGKSGLEILIGALGINPKEIQAAMSATVGNVQKLSVFMETIDGRLKRIEKALNIEPSEVVKIENKDAANG